MPSGPDIRAVFFDIGNVLLRFNARDLVRALARAAGRSPFHVARLIWAHRIVDTLERGRMSTEEVFALFREELGFRGDLGRFKRLWCDHFRLDRKTAGLLKRVASRKKAYLLSNTNALHYDFIRERYAFSRLVHGAVLSYKLELRKPEAGIYEAALRLARVRPEQAVFFDDLEANVRGALKVGMRAFRYAGPQDLERRLKALGVL